jgi:hypothetical protein
MLKVCIHLCLNLCLLTLTAGEITQRKLNSLLIKSINHNKLAAVNTYLEQGADINCANRLGDRPITLAIEKQNYPLVHELLARGADVDAHDGNNRTPLMLAMECQNSDSKAIFERVLVDCPDLAIADLDGNTALTDAVEAKDCYYLKKILTIYDAGYLAGIKNKNNQNLTDLVLQEQDSRKLHLLCNYPIFKNQVTQRLISKLTNIAAHECPLSAEVVSTLAHGLNKFPEFGENRKKRRIEPEHSYYI